MKHLKTDLILKAAKILGKAAFEARPGSWQFKGDQSHWHLPAHHASQTPLSERHRPS
jgi:hypothetical protein